MLLLCSTGAFSRNPDYIDYRAVLQYGPQLDVNGLVQVQESSCAKGREAARMRA